MTERPILFSAPMVRAILAGTKTQTRRVAKGVHIVHEHTGEALARLDSTGPRIPCPYGMPGDRLWVRETFQRFSEDGYTLYKADPEGLKEMNELKHDECLEARWRPSIHMPRAVSRITLEITSVRVERLQDISEADALAEGVEQWAAGACAKGNPHGLTPDGYFELLWSSINGRESWDADPLVWVVEFKRVV